MRNIYILVITILIISCIILVYEKPKEGDMKTSEVGIELIKEFEGKRQVAYQDPAGVWTIGYGHTKDVYEGQLCIEKACDRYLAEDIQEVEEYIEKLVEVPLTQNQYDALVSWTFNLGPTNLKESTLLRKLNYGDYEAVPEEMKKWIYVGDDVLDGLVARRNAEAELFSALDK